MPNGQYEGTVHYTGDGTYSESDKPITVVIKNSDVVDPKNPLGDLTELVSNTNGQVVVNLPKDAAGEVIITINGKVFSGNVVNGNVVLDLSELPDGNFTGTLLYTGDQAHNYSHSSKSVVVVINTQVPVDPSNPLGNINQVTSTGDGKVEIPFPADATGSVKVTINGKDYYGIIEDGRVVLDTTDIPEGKYNATVNYYGDSKYSASEKTIPVTIKHDPEGDPSNPMGDLSEVTSTGDGKVEIPFPADATGAVKVTINGKDYYGTIENGKVVLDTSDLPNGNYDATVNYYGDSKYSASQKNVNININHEADPTNPMGDLSEVTSTGDGKVEIPFPADATGAVKVTINGKDYYGTIVDGKVVLDTTDLPAGNYNATVNYYGDNKYSPSEKTVPLTVEDKNVDPTNPMGDITEVQSGDDGKVEIPFPSDATGIVVVNIGGKDYPASIVDGKVVLDTTDVPVGNHTAVIKYYGDSKYSASEKNVTVIIKEIITPVDPKNPMGNVTEVKSNDEGKVEIPFPADATGAVKVTINGKDYIGTIVDGKVVLDTSDIPAGNYNATINYYGDSKYSASEKTVPVTIKEDEIVSPTNPMGNTTEVKSGDDGKVEIPFPEDATGAVKVTINGKDYYGNIVDGKVVLDTKDIPAGNYTATVNYYGDTKYSASEKTINFIINEPSKEPSVVDPTNPINNVSEVKSSDDGKVEIPFHKDATGQVVVNINGKDYPARIEDGKIVFDTKDVPQGNYNATVKYAGDDKYPASEKTVTMIVKEYHSSTTNNNNIIKEPAKKTKKASKITAKKKTFKKSLKVKKYSITLKSGNTPIKKVQVTIKVGKKTYKAKTNAKGKATFKIKKLTKKGKYNAVVKFKGNKNYKATSKKVKITVK